MEEEAGKNQKQETEEKLQNLDGVGPGLHWNLLKPFIHVQLKVDPKTNDHHKNKKGGRIESDSNASKEGGQGHHPCYARREEPLFSVGLEKKHGDVQPNKDQLYDTETDNHFGIGFRSR